MSKRRKKIGLAPGSVVFTGNRKVDKILIHHLQYDSKTLTEKTLDYIDEVTVDQPSKDYVDWYDMRGIHDTQLIEQLGRTFSIHPLALEDIADTHQRPKFDEYEEGNFIVLRALTFDHGKFRIVTEQIALYFNINFVASFQETESDLFATVRKRVELGNGKIRQRGADYLVYALVDTVVDNYYLVLEETEVVIASLEEKLMNSQDISSKGEIHRLKKELQIIRKTIAPLREAIGRFAKTENIFVEERNLIFIRDLYDHVIQITDMVESQRDLLNGLQDLFMTEVSFKMNKIMQVLTLVATIFIPLTFLAGVYGMNFDNMPELHWKYSYFVLLGVMVVLFIALLIYFKKKKWI